MVCLETTFLIDVLRGRTKTVAHLRQLVNSSDTVTLAAPTLFEVMEGVCLSRTKRERNQIQEVLQHVTVLPLDRETAWRAAELSAQLIEEGQTIGQMDTLIAAIAMHHNESMLTRNVKTFSRIPGLVVEEYSNG